MHYVGIRELKNRLTYYLGLTRDGDNVIVTDRGRPMAILHTLETVDETAGVEERLLSLAGKGLVRLPRPKTRLSQALPRKIKGRAVSALITEDRR